MKYKIAGNNDLGPANGRVHFLRHSRGKKLGRENYIDTMPESQGQQEGPEFRKISSPGDSMEDGNSGNGTRKLD
jgi:hypothetical protein